MQVRHRNGPGNGYRSNAMGMRGSAPASRISPDSSMRGHQVYNSESRNYNRGGYGRGSSHPRQFQPPPPPPTRENDIFVEAGRLAAAYLVFKGVLPPNALSGKWRNDGLRNQRADSQVFRSHGDSQVTTGGRESAHLHLGNSSIDPGPTRRNFSHEDNSMVFRNSVRGRRSGSFKHHESEVSRELGRSGSWAEKSLVSPSMEGHLDDSAGRHDEQPVVKDGNGGRQSSSSSPGEKTREGDSATHLESGLKKCNPMEEEVVKESSSNGKNETPDANEEIIKESDDADKFQAKSVKEGQYNNPLEQNQEENKEVTASAREHASDRKDNADLSKHGKFENVHTEAPSEQVPIIVDRDNSARELSAGSGIHDVDVGDDISAANASSHQNQEFNESNILDAPSTGRGEKRVLDDDTDCREDSKRPREWVPSINDQSDGCLPLSRSLENQPTLLDQRTSQSSNATLSPEQKSLDVSFLPEDQGGSSEFMQEKQLFPGPFKTYDLNLNGASDVNENHPADSVLISQSFTDNGKEATPIDVDLCMNYSFNLPKTNSKHGIRDIEIEVIDLENDSGQEDQIFSNPERRGDTVFTDLDGFPNNVHNANEVPDVQDGYGLMISELLGNDSPNCSSLPSNLNSLNNDVGLPNEEGLTGDDDSIYMSLEEIPISFLRAWEQPTQDFGKPF